MPDEEGFQAVDRKHHWERWLEGPPHPPSRASAAAVAAALRRATGSATMQHAGQFDVLSGTEDLWVRSNQDSCSLEYLARAT